nr:glycosyltransferase family 2 protein [Methanoculleus bourgensis]
MLDGIPDYVAKVYAVNDGSSDRTGEIIDDYARRDPRIVPIHHSPNRGVGAAITSGYKRAVADGMEIAAVMAGDNQMDPAYLPALLDPIVEGRADYTKGNRLINEAYRKGMSPWRSFGNSLLTFLTKIASGYWQMMDPQNGYTAISVKALAELPLDSIYQGYGYCNNLLIWLNICGCRVPRRCDPGPLRPREVQDPLLDLHPPGLPSPPQQLPLPPQDEVHPDGFPTPWRSSTRPGRCSPRSE